MPLDARTWAQELGRAPLPSAMMCSAPPGSTVATPHAFAKEGASMSLYDVPLATLQGEPASLADYADEALLIVNVASKCGLTPQYEGLEQLHEQYVDRGLVVLGFPCNQFGGQEPGTEEEIATFCSTTYGVTFPMFAKIDVNGQDRHPLYEQLTEVADAEGKAGDVVWNFEKFLVAPREQQVQRFRPLVEPESEELKAAIEAVLPR